MKDNWINKSEMMLCKSCMYFVTKGEQVGRCRRNAPTMKGWPVMFITDWCGEHKLDSDKLVMVNAPPDKLKLDVLVRDLPDKSACYGGDNQGGENISGPKGY